MKKLNPQEIQNALSPLPSGLKIETYVEITSTNDMGHQLAKQGASENTVVLAEKQTAGRGRLDRSWESPAFKNIYLSIILRPTLTPNKTPQINLIAGLAAYRTFLQLLPKGLHLKWPNDLLFKNKKLGGVLTEMELTPEGGVDYMIVGVGLNINAESSDFSASLKDTATSLKMERKEEFSRSQIAGMFLNEFFNLYQRYQKESLQPFLYEWENAAQMKGKKVKVDEGDKTFEGICLGLDAEGYLLVDSQGKKETVVAGDVSWV